ncbi:MAG: hypothetical protein DA329_12635 [Candidatus Nitrosocosmicus sp.]|jgi:hypothetical protein|nr:hypothetical protein [Candidatus Nitrosocosmicus sp.]
MKDEGLSTGDKSILLFGHAKLSLNFFLGGKLKNVSTILHQWFAFTVKRSLYNFPLVVNKMILLFNYIKLLYFIS